MSVDTHTSFYGYDNDQYYDAFQSNLSDKSKTYNRYRTVAKYADYNIGRIIHYL